MIAIVFWLIAFFASLAGIVFLVIRHFDALSAFDITSVPHVQEKTTKQTLVAKRVQRNMKKFATRLLTRFQPVAHGWQKLQGAFRESANKIADQYRQLEWKKKWSEWKLRSRDERRAHLLKLLEEADEYRRAENFDPAEKNYVEIISLDPKNVNAYIGLGKLYFRQDKFKEAVEATRYVVEKLDASAELAWAFLGRALEALDEFSEAVVAFNRALALNGAMVKRWVDLGDCYKELGDLSQAANAYKKAAELEPLNPRVLDHLVEISIQSGDKRLASEAFAQLQIANPENQKLVEWGARIAEM
ncbi:MAG: tetratricopeptide repeat protein [Candidatus Magasanikbacteria bacterium]|nr:tetratricopeptide repeat protein [Candidatus Magasanikbacteria bacterium]